MSHRNFPNKRKTELNFFWGMWSAPLFFIVLYYCTFDRWVMTPADRIRFRELVDANRKRRQDTT